MVQDKRLEAGLQAMENLARKMGLEHGVGCIIVEPVEGRPYAEFLFLDAIARAPDPDTHGEEDAGTNYFGIAMEKAAFSLSSRMDSGAKQPLLKSGEVEYRGCIILPEASSGSIVYFTFSGGTEDQDVEIDNAGLKAFVQTAG